MIAFNILQLELLLSMQKRNVKNDTSGGKHNANVFEQTSLPSRHLLWTAPYRKSAFNQGRSNADDEVDCTSSWIIPHLRLSSAPYYWHYFFHF